MSNTFKNTEEILQKLGINQLNPMQEDAFDCIQTHADVVLLSPTGSGKTLAFLLPIIAQLNPEISGVQVLILVPSRELAIQIEQVIRTIGAGFKANAIYGGRSSAKDKIELNHLPTILVGTPGRIASHLNRESFDLNTIKTLVLDEFDKSLEIGFETEMKEIISQLKAVKYRILTSATYGVKIPNFVGLRNAKTISYIDNNEGKTSLLEVKRVVSPTKDKLDSLLQLICFMGNQAGIIFCNYKNSIEWLSTFLTENNINHDCFYGDMEQIDREKSLIKFRNGSTQILIATDLAARGIDIPELKFIIHYQLPFKAEEFTHRNGRTARMNKEGIAYILHGQDEVLPDFLHDFEEVTIPQKPKPQPTEWKTIFITGGRKDKISKGDIAGLFCKQGKLTADQIGNIELQNNAAYIAVQASKAKQLIQLVDNSKLKNKKIKVRLV